MSVYFKLYFAEDDTEVSTEDNFENSVDFVLRADLEEDDEVRLYALAEEDYLVADFTITPTGATAAKWALAPDAAGPASGSYEDFGDPLNIGTVNDSDKVYFWAKAKATSDEVPINDTTVVLLAQGVVQAT